MRTARFFVPPEWLALQSGIFSIPAGFLHKQIVQVLRMKLGDEITLLQNDGDAYTCTITTINRSNISGTITAKESPLTLPPYTLTLCASITKRDTFEWMIQKCTELGVHAFIPLHTERTIKKTPDIHKRWSDIAKEASEQCGRITLPIIHTPCTLPHAFAQTKACARILFHESAQEYILPSLQPSMPVALFIGPEGGFSEHELTLAQKERIHVRKMGSFVLRAETAAIVACSKFLC